MTLKLLTIRIVMAFLLITGVSPAAFPNTDPNTGKTLVVSGKISSVEGEFIPYANIMVMGTVKGTYTNLDGTFQIFDLADGDYMIKVSAIGYKTFTQPIKIINGQITELELSFEETGVEMPQFTVIADKDRIFSKVPGSVSYIDQKELRNLSPISGNEAIRRSPGVHVVDEEGVGMRVNIGIRGLDPDRSRSVMMMEDGVPIALAPYGEPEMYYTPAIDRMSGVEILKGSGQILYGPQTIGGVVNYITANPPQEEQGTVKVQAGDGGFFSGMVSYGNTFGNTGISVNILKKRADQIGYVGFDITDFNTKLLFDINSKSSLGVKMGVYDEVSDATYIGLTQTMFDAGGQDFTRMAPDDRLGVRRYSLSFSHKYDFSPKVRLNTIAYGYTTTRNWNRQDFSRNTSSNTPPSNWTGVTWGDTNIPNGAVFMRNSTGNRDRQFEVAGIEPRLEIDHNLFSKNNELIIGTRYLYEKAYEQRVNGTKAGVSSGNLVEDEIRSGHAFSAYAQNKLNLSERFLLSAGVRLENFDYDRQINRRSFPGVGIRDTLLVANNAITEVIPGIGFNYKPTQLFSLFGGAHRGFAPPRVKDAISNLGEPYELEAEKSWNYELGFRTDIKNWIFLEFTGFMMNFSNQIIPVSESSGGQGSGLVNGGATTHRGVEGALVMELSKLFGLKRNKIVYDFNTAIIDAEFSEDRFLGDVNISGNRTPYSPGFFFNSAITFESQSGFGARLLGNFVSSQFTDEINSLVPNPNGETGQIDSYFVLDAVVNYNVSKWNSTFNLTIKNITDERYMVSRRPQGIRLGLPRMISAGFEFRF
ncbi:TonB-dependent receptor [Cognataquiflexum rubidum]|uniref:TonB-dependent receptor n=1 Tax=Cognataquiflexum rubidum TaxID=2922273 RepID=UPI001F12E6BA|nr:TonB-dependent receptor [Cognataquiflexum rubidum]MCH6236645.1 TonB-dependent receptor [Cognataquiflexum rubidum]